MVLARLTPAVAQQLALGARDVLAQGAAVLTGNQGGYIANGDPQSIYGKIQQATARQYCRRYADDPGAVPGGVGVVVENACRPYLDSIGYGGPPTIAPPAQGGQCPGVSYWWDYETPQLAQFPGCGITYGNTRRGPYPGPLTVEQTRGAESSRCPGVARYTMRLLNADTGAELDTTGTGNSGDVGYRNVRFTRVDGLPDTCGNPPPDVQPPTPPPIPGPRRERYNPGPDIDIDIDIEINPDGGFDVDFGVGPVTVAPPGGDGGGGGGGGAQPDPGSPGAPEPTGPGGDAEGEAPPNSVLVGLRIEVLEFPAEPKLYAAGVYRGVCYVYMGTEGLLDHDPAGAMLRADQFVYAERENLTHWRVSANTGYSLRVTPYYKELEAEAV